MDLVRALPREISLHILSFLSPKELGNCFSVSKCWYSLVNTDYLWKRHCQISHIDLDCFIKTKPSTLCKCASVFRSFMRRMIKWDGDKAKYFTVNLVSGDFVLAFSESSVAIHYFSPFDETIEKLHFYYVYEEDIKCQEILDLDLPGKGVVQLFKTDVYTVISRDNFVLCIKKVSGNHINYVAICLRGGILEYAQDDITCFISSKRCLSRDVVIRGLYDCYLWLEDDRSSMFHVFNLENSSSVSFVSLNEIKMTKDLVALWSHTDVQVFSLNGTAIHTLKVDSVHDLCYNKCIIACLLHNSERQVKWLLQTFDINTSQKLIERTVMRYTDITLHNACDSIYTLERSSRDLYRVSSICGRSGRTQWSTSQPNMYYSLWPATLRLVSPKHLFVWPSNHRTDKYSVFNCETGKHLYVSDKILGSIQWVSSSICISNEGNVLHIKCFL